mmetsp:Transcript_19648/g.48638  ORF Transcript_19648/g.48638 Transcript_19648/m.48638 type:complete len:339 (-) Transcript_19648:565-1581(-)
MRHLAPLPPVTKLYFFARCFLSSCAKVLSRSRNRRCALSPRLPPHFRPPAVSSILRRSMPKTSRSAGQAYDWTTIAAGREVSSTAAALPGLPLLAHVAPPLPASPLLAVAAALGVSSGGVAGLVAGNSGPFPFPTYNAGAAATAAPLPLAPLAPAAPRMRLVAGARPAATSVSSSPSPSLSLSLSLFPPAPNMLFMRPITSTSFTLSSAFRCLAAASSLVAAISPPCTASVTFSIAARVSSLYRAFSSSSMDSNLRLICRSLRLMCASAMASSSRSSACLENSMIFFSPFTCRRRRPLRSRHASKLVVVPAELAAPRSSAPNPPFPPASFSSSVQVGK